MIAAQHGVALAASGDGREEPKYDSAVAAVDNVVGDLELTGGPDDLPDLVGFRADLGPEHFQSLSSSHPIAADGRSGYVADPFGKRRHYKRAERVTLVWRNGYRPLKISRSIDNYVHGCVLPRKMIFARKDICKDACGLPDNVREPVNRDR